MSETEDGPKAFVNVVQEDRSQAASLFTKK